MNVRTEGNAPLPLGATAAATTCVVHRETEAPLPGMGCARPDEARGRDRIAGNRSVRWRPLAPSPPPPRIAIASDVPPRGRKMVILVRDRACRQPCVVSDTKRRIGNRGL